MKTYAYRKTLHRAVNLFAALLLFTSSTAWSQSGQGSARNRSPLSTTLPSDSNLLAHPDWNEQCRARAEAVVGKRVDLLFLGDSITQNWTDPDWGDERRGRRVWAEYYAQQHALNFGVGADKTQNLLWRMNHMPIAGLHPRVAVVMVGVNNYEDPPEAIAAGIKAVLDKTSQMYPGIRIILTSILPNRVALQKTTEVNALTRQFADDRNIFYLDLVPLFLPLADNWVGMGADHLHPNETGYRIWAQAMAPLLNRLMPEAPPTASSQDQSSRVNPASTPTARDEPWWKARHDAILATLAQHPDPELLMIGDSITNNYDKANPPDENFQPIWQQYYSPRHAMNLGYSGDTTANVLWRLQHGEVDGIRPKAAVLLIGTNNTGWKNQTALQTESGIDAVVAELRNRLPDTQILLMGILPSDSAAPVVQANRDVNTYLAAHYQNASHVHYLDIGNVFFKDGKLETDIFYDPRLPHPGTALHPDTKGQRRMAKAIEPTLSTLLQETP